jgi:V/A-type H+-transporting ATPase subunit I
MYGTPLYNEFDPTPLVAITYSIIFGLMFGDIGQGLVLVLAGWALWFLKKINLGRVMGICGIFSIAGGFLYGSIFGYEQFLDGFRPLESSEDFNLSLGVSIGIGVVLLLFSMGINVSNGIRQKNIGKIFFSSNGIAGLLFYGSVISGVIALFLFPYNLFTPLYVIFLIALPLLTMFLREPLTEFIEHKVHHKKATGEKVGKVEFIIQNFFELFEVVLSYVTNTISFVRIGAFALNHAGLMMFVFILARMSGKGDNLFIVIVGNAFVILLEGLIVGIQVLRIQFYELFSNFYSGEGKPFEPISIQYNIH